MKKLVRSPIAYVLLLVVVLLIALSAFRSSPHVDKLSLDQYLQKVDSGQVASAIVRVVDTPFGKRPFRVHIDPSQDGAEVVAAVADRVRREMFRTIGLADLLSPRVVG